MYEAGDLDVLSLGGFSSIEIERVRQCHAGEYLSVPVLSTGYVGFNVSRPPFDDRRVRQAFVLAVDREALGNVAQSGFHFPATGGFVPPGMPGHTAGIALPYDPGLARRLLAEAGYPRGRGLPALQALTIVGTTPYLKPLRMQWRDVLGAEVVWRVEEWRVFHERMETEPPHLCGLAWAADYPDPDSFLRAGPVQRHTRWRNERYDELVARAGRTTDQDERMRLYGQVEQILADEAPVMPLMYQRAHLLVKPWVRTYPTSAAGLDFWPDVVIEPHEPPGA
jgi:ABC-type transport system substrate-binding protein